MLQGEISHVYIYICMYIGTCKTKCDIHEPNVHHEASNPRYHRDTAYHIQVNVRLITAKCRTHYKMYIRLYKGKHLVSTCMRYIVKQHVV